MSDYSYIEPLIHGMACICDAQELLRGPANREEINERLEQALQAFESVAHELGSNNIDKE